jgi:hypothetical protein
MSYEGRERALSKLCDRVGWLLNQEEPEDQEPLMRYLDLTVRR